MFEGHNPYLVALSVVIAILGGYTGFGLAARIRARPGVNRRLLLAGAAGFLALSIWTMHFIGMLAAPIPADAVYLVLPTIVSFLICALVVGVSLFFVSIGEPSDSRVTASALLLGAGVVSMHYVGIHGLAGGFRIEHERAMVMLAALIAAGTAYGGLRIFLARQGGMRLALSAAAFGVAVSGMHYTAMYGMHFRPAADISGAGDGLVASPEVLALVLAFLCFLITAGFLLFLVPEPRDRSAAAVAGGLAVPEAGAAIADAFSPDAERAYGPIQRPLAAPLGGLGQPRSALAARLPIEGADGTHFIDIAEIRSVKADAHYTLVHDGTRERMCPWSISQAEAQLDPAFFVRVHRSHIVAIPHVTFVRKEGDGAIVELDGTAPHRVPVSRAKIAELKARLGVAGRRAH
jgi:NO-binding membrane sensor protein with MHYT domain